MTEPINRFGDYTLNLDRKPPQPDYGYTLKQAASSSFVPIVTTPTSLHVWRSKQVQRARPG